MSLENPQRLKNSEEFGPAVRAASLDGQMTSAQLEASAVAIQARLATGSSGLALLLKGLFGGGLVLLAVLAANHFAGSPTGAPQSPAGPAPAQMVGAVVLADAGIVSDTEPAAEAVDAGVAVAVAVAPPRSRKRSAPPADAGSAIAPVVDAGAPPSLDLSVQLQLYERATKLGRAGHYAEGIAVIDELFARYPQTVVRSDALLTKAEFLIHAGRDRKALPLLEELAAMLSQRHRRGELLRVQGDLLRRLGDCPAARKAYDRAQRNALSREEAAAVGRGLAHCR